jgi:HD-GYP domain-containing protein (c-di-GMP phosphodiesterase class II)
LTVIQPAPAPRVLECIDLFVQQLQRTTDSGRQLHAALDMVRGATAADLALVYGGGAVAAWSALGRPDLRSSAALAALLVEKGRAGEGQWAGALHVEAGSAAVLRLSRSRDLWLVVLRRCGEPLGESDLKLMALARRLLVQQQQAQDGQNELRDVLFGLVRCLTAALDARDPYTCGHSERVARIAVRVGEQLRLPESARSELYLGGLLHDVGKIGVSDEVLRKPGKLTDEEFELVKQHVVIGDAIVSHVRQLAHLRPLVRNHHERYDGGGYPDGLVGEQIPLPARILAVADACDAMISDRPYRKGMAPAKVEQVLCDGAGRQWDAELIGAFLECKSDVLSIAQRGLGDSVYQAVDHALRCDNGAERYSPQGQECRPSAQG